MFLNPISMFQNQSYKYNIYIYFTFGLISTLRRNIEIHPLGILINIRQVYVNLYLSSN